LENKRLLGIWPRTTLTVSCRYGELLSFFF
jgi:hypothetical protein